MTSYAAYLTLAYRDFLLFSTNFKSTQQQKLHLRCQVIFNHTDIFSCFFFSISTTRERTCHFDISSFYLQTLLRMTLRTRKINLVWCFLQSVWKLQRCIDSSDKASNVHNSVYTHQMYVLTSGIIYTWSDTDIQSNQKAFLGGNSLWLHSLLLVVSPGGKTFPLKNN